MIKNIKIIIALALVALVVILVLFGVLYAFDSITTESMKMYFINSVIGVGSVALGAIIINWIVSLIK